MLGELSEIKENSEDYDRSLFGALNTPMRRYQGIGGIQSSGDNEFYLDNDNDTLRFNTESFEHGHFRR